MLICFIMQKGDKHTGRDRSAVKCFTCRWNEPSLLLCYSRQPSATAKPFSHKTPIGLAIREWSTICSAIGLHFIKTPCLFARKHDGQSAFMFQRNHFFPPTCMRLLKKRHCQGQFSMNNLPSDFFFFILLTTLLLPLLYYSELNTLKWE